MEEEPKKELIIFGHDVAQMPCFRNSFLYGISGGIGVGLVTFLATSRTRFSTHVAFSGFVCGTLGYWFVCRYQWSKTRFEYQKLQTAMRNKAMYEGTEVEREIFKEA
ncbi:cytochrome c oxidase assembly protein COX20, mitochondrial [Teleopsis dalmanni]|uniref:cytochrome c oxidase assembly protein COX20, mitochondrial n=1 Tax=Teleopsis dalmanni TaxID=139649 RepID=UPI0018CE9A21|nr:cytochrome c oxidase assembly protein COX20, mitochondrial [Teleopsis dalmanni]